MNDLISYDHTTGVFTWKVKRSGTKSVRKPCPNGYIYIGINGKRYLAHRLAWYLHYGHWPEKQIDHINRDKTDNRIENLRTVSHRENNINKDTFRGGCCFNKVKLKWQSQIRYKGRRYHLGLFKTKEEAMAAYETARRKYEDELEYEEFN